MEKQNKKSFKTIGILLLVMFIAFAGAGYVYYRVFKKPNFSPQKTVYVYVRPETSFDDLLLQLKDVGKLNDEKSFLLWADYKKYSENMKTGRYAVEPNMTNNQLLRNLMSGKQSPIRLTFNNIRTIPQFAGKVSQQLMIDSLTLLNTLQDKALLAQSGYTRESLPALFIPDTYEVYWNISPEKFFERMKKEFDRFWNPARLEKAEKIGLTPVQIGTLASIVEEETNKKDEFSIVAGLYINRLKKGMKLQADPTVKYAVGDFTLRRILNVHLEKESPYNTYLNYGLPPGPIRFPSGPVIDAVLNYSHHDYIFMCAKEDLSGRHNFAVTAQEHSRNRDKYVAALNRLKIYR